MSNISIYGGGGSGQIARAVTRQSRAAIVDVLSAAEVANARVTEAQFIFRRTVGAGVEGYAECVDAEREVPGSSTVTAPLLRQYRGVLGDILMRGTR